MSASTAIGMVSQSLRRLLIGEMRLTPAVAVTILAPDETGGERRINLFLYRLQENEFLKNQDWQPRLTAPNQLVPPPLSLNLFYLMMAYAPNDSQAGNAAAHEILGEALRVFYENPIIPRTYLVDGLRSAREQFKIMLQPLDMNELSSVWGTFNRPMRPCLLYTVQTAQIDKQPAAERALAPRVRSIGVPDVRAPYNPPVVETMTPISGPAGTVITFSGQYLTGWNVYIDSSGVPLVDGQEIAGDRFTMTMPAIAPPGLYELRVDIAHLYRRVFFFEVR